MNNYEFTLKFSLPNSQENPGKYVEQLGAVGCDDALIGIGQQGRISLNFIRESSSADEAISSAIDDVKRAIPAAKLIEATPDLVGLTEVADLIGCTRPNMKEIMINGGSAFPIPVHEGNPAIWHLATILSWLQETNTYQIEETLVDVAKTNMQVNIAREIDNLEPNLQQKVLFLSGTRFLT